jgi:hypothetical protein
MAGKNRQNNAKKGILKTEKKHISQNKSFLWLINQTFGGTLDSLPKSIMST